jgi:hypothetical protein
MESHSPSKINRQQVDLEPPTTRISELERENIQEEEREIKIRMTEI